MGRVRQNYGEKKQEMLVSWGPGFRNFRLMASNAINYVRLPVYKELSTWNGRVFRLLTNLLLTRSTLRPSPVSHPRVSPQNPWSVQPQSLPRTFLTCRVGMLSRKNELCLFFRCSRPCCLTDLTVTARLAPAREGEMTTFHNEARTKPAKVQLLRHSLSGAAFLCQFDDLLCALLQNLRLLVLPSMLGNAREASDSHGPNSEQDRTVAINRQQTT